MSNETTGISRAGGACSPHGLTRDRLAQIMSYDPETGVFVWIKSKDRPSRRPEKTGYVDDKGYLRVRVDGHAYRAHQLAWLYVHGAWPAHVVDHINGNKLDNRIINLRDVPCGRNVENQKSATKASLSGVLGTSVIKNGRFAARIKVNRKNVYLGAFDTAEAAHAEYVKAKRIFHPGSTL